MSLCFFIFICIYVQRHIYKYGLLYGLQLFSPKSSNKSLRFKSQVFGPPKRLSLQEVFGGSDTDPHKQKAIYLENHPN